MAETLYHTLADVWRALLVLTTAIACTLAVVGKCSLFPIKRHFIRLAKLRIPLLSCRIRFRKHELALESLLKFLTLDVLKATLDKMFIFLLLQASYAVVSKTFALNLLYFSLLS